MLSAFVLGGEEEGWGWGMVRGFRDIKKNLGTLDFVGTRARCPLTQVTPSQSKTNGIGSVFRSILNHTSPHHLALDPVTDLLISPPATPSVPL